MRRFLVLVMFFYVTALSPVILAGEAMSSEQNGIQVSLNAVLEKVSNNYLLLEKAKAKLKAEEAHLKAVKSGFFPKLETDVSALGTSGKTGSAISWNIGIRWPVFEGFKRVHEIKRGHFRVEEEKLRGEEEKLNLICEIKGLYVEALKETELLKLTQGWVRDTSRNFKILKVLFEKELVSEKEYLRAKTLNQEARFELVKHKENRDYYERLLRDLMNLKENERLELEPFTELESGNLEYESWVENLRQTHPHYKLSQLKAGELEEEVKILGSERFPKLSLIARYHVFQDDFVDQNRFEAGIMGSWNIWDFGVLGNELKAKRAEVEEEKIQNQLEAVKLERSLRKVLSGLKVEKERIRSLKAWAKEKREIYQETKMKFIYGEESGLHVLDAFIEKTKSELKLLEVIYGCRLLEAELQKYNPGGIHG